MRLLVVEDEARIASFLIKGLSDQGHQVECVATGAEALERAREPDLDLLILDLGLEDIDGLDVLRRLRAEGRSLPVIILTARGDVEDRVEGFRLGADDYLTKPFAFEELVARIEARVRPRAGERRELESDEVRLDPRALRAEIGGESLQLTEREFLLLTTFFVHAGQVLSREQLLAEVWGASVSGGDDVVDVYVRSLRGKLGEGRIETVPGVGYRFSANGR